MSSIGPVLTALASLAGTTLTGFQVVAGSDASVTTTGGQVVAVGDQPITGRADLDSLALTSMTEQYAVPVVVSVSLGGPTSQQQAITAAMSAYAALSQAIRLDQTLGLGEGVSALPTGDFSMTPTATEAGRQAAVRFSVAVFAQTA